MCQFAVAPSIDNGANHSGAAADAVFVVDAAAKNHNISFMNCLACSRHTPISTQYDFSISVFFQTLSIADTPMRGTFERMHAVCARRSGTRNILLAVRSQPNRESHSVVNSKSDSSLAFLFPAHLYRFIIIC